MVAKQRLDYELAVFRMRPKSQSIKDENGTFPAYAWPGGYPIVYITDDCEIICPKCKNTESEIYTDGDWDVYYEGPPEICVNCNAEIESAYGDPEEGN